MGVLAPHDRAFSRKSVPIFERGTEANLKMVPISSVPIPGARRLQCTCRPVCSRVSRPWCSQVLIPICDVVLVLETGARVEWLGWKTGSGAGRGVRVQIGRERARQRQERVAK